MWFLTTGSMVILPVIFAEFSESSIQFSDIHCCLFFCWHLPVGSYHRRRMFRDFHGIQFGRVEVLPADHLHAISPVSLWMRLANSTHRLVQRMKLCPFLFQSFDFYFIKRLTFVFSDVCLKHVELVPKLLCPSMKSLKIPAARRPEIRNTTVAQISQ